MSAPQYLRNIAAPAKLNLFLHVTGRRADGYHTLQTVFQLIDLCDWLDFELRPDGQLTLADDSGVPAEENLVLRAARALQAHANAGAGAHITLRKHIPQGGGLGGGSSDAATTLLALNRLWALHLPQDVLAEIGLQLGADVPFFLLGQNAWAEGIGDQLTPLELPQRWFLVMHPGPGVSTPAVFRHPDLTRNTPDAIITDFAQQWQAGSFFGHNDLQGVAVKLENSVQLALDLLPNSRMTGSGACVFAAFDTPARANAASVAVKLPDGMQAWVVQGLARHPAHLQIAQAQ